VVVIRKGKNFARANIIRDGTEVKDEDKERGGEKSG